MTTRFSKRDMELINSALGLYEAEDPEITVDGLDEADEDRAAVLEERHLRDLATVRQKVWARLDVLGSTTHL